MPFFLQRDETEKGFPKTPVSVRLIFYAADAGPQHLTKLKAGIGKALVCRTGVEGKGDFMILLHTLAVVIQTAEGILRIFVLFICGQGEPVRRLQIVLLCAKPCGNHFADAVLGILPRLFFLGGMKHRKCLFVPAIGGISIRFAPKPVGGHPVKIIERKGIIIFRF
ncbi:hypothetical protein DSECCO2_608280 [anaerobic digester metagenome]